MARKRKTYQEQKKQPEQQIDVPVLEWPTAIYARLSIVNSGKDDDGDSIENQVEICRDYLEEHPYLHLHDIYMDNGWTGTNTNRPEFQRMLDDIHAGKVKAIIIKDFSRFSRDYIEAGNLLENVFPFLGVRFISVADGYDSFETDGSAQSLLIPLKNLINSYYSKDISRKVSTAVHSQQMAGRHLPSQIPYGYRKSETKEYRMEPDPETAPIVKRIFKEILEGTPIHQVVKELNKENIPSPGQIRFRRGQTIRPCYEKSEWSQECIKQIIRNPTYMGDMVFGRMPTALYLGKPNYSYEKDESKWRVLPDMHEPLVERAVFYKIREMLTKNREKQVAVEEAGKEYRKNNPAIFKGYVFCGDCGGTMYARRSRLVSDPGKASVYYICGKYLRHRCFGNHTVYQRTLEKIVWNAVQDQIKYFCDFQKVVLLIKENKKQTSMQTGYRDEIQKILARISRCMQKRENLYEDFSDGLLSAEDYTAFKQKYDEEYQMLNKNLNHLQTAQSRLNKSLSDKNQWLLHMQTVQTATNLSPELLDTMIDKILVFQVEREIRVEIKFKYQDDFAILQSAYEEMEGDLRE